jgi:hypothetical protein
MPKSKHRRKAGGKSIAHPGRGRPFKSFESPEARAFAQFIGGYTRPFLQQFPNEEDANYMLDLISDAAFTFYNGTTAFRPVTKADMFREFIEPVRGEPPNTLEMAETALTFLVEQAMVEVADDQIIVPTRFIPAPTQAAS